MLLHDDNASLLESFILDHDEYNRAMVALCWLAKNLEFGWPISEVDPRLALP